jgi:hypothetical protein
VCTIQVHGKGRTPRGYHVAASSPSVGRREHEHTVNYSSLPSVITAAHGKALWQEKKNRKWQHVHVAGTEAIRARGQDRGAGMPFLLSLPEEAHRREVGRGTWQVRDGGILRAAGVQGEGWPRRAVEVGPTATNRKSSGRQNVVEVARVASTGGDVVEAAFLLGAAQTRRSWQRGPNTHRRHAQGRAAARVN